MSGSSNSPTKFVEEIRLRINLRCNKATGSSIHQWEPETDTSCEQESTEHLVHKTYEERSKQYQEHCMRLCKFAHLSYLKERLLKLPESQACLDASQPWLVYWTLHGLRLLHYEPSNAVIKDSIAFLNSCQNESGGFGGGPHQLSHLATTYASVNALAELACPAALEIINKTTLYDWLYSLRNETDGSFRMHHGGETDIRGCYCALSVASLCEIIDEKLTKNTAKWIASCQTYEGGFGGNPGLEAHGGYSFCAVASLIILNSLHLINLPALLRWTANRQMPMEGGFQGRTNKLVDSCYSFWVGGIFALIQPHLLSVSKRQSDLPASADDMQQVSFDPSTASNSTFLLMDWLFDSTALQDYIIICCQRYPLRGPIPSSHHPLLSVMEGGANSGGGLVDKPGKNPDSYHSSYSLSGLSLAQHPFYCRLNDGKSSTWTLASGAYDNSEDEVSPVEPVYNITLDSYKVASSYFRNSP